MPRTAQHNRSNRHAGGDQQAERGSALKALLDSEEPAIRWKTRVGVLGEDPDSKQMRGLREEIRTCPRVKALLARRDKTGRLISKRSVYDKWQGAHWVLATLADLGYPAQDESLLAMRDQVLSRWLDQEFYEEFVAETKSDAYKKDGVPVMQGRHRRCASQQGYALYYLIKLGLEDARVDDLVERLLHWRWPDGGWNCDRIRRSQIDLHPYGSQHARSASVWQPFSKDESIGRGQTGVGDIPFATPLQTRVEWRGDEARVHQAPLPALLAL